MRVKSVTINCENHSSVSYTVINYCNGAPIIINSIVVNPKNFYVILMVSKAIMDPTNAVFHYDSSWFHNLNVNEVRVIFQTFLD